MANPTPPRIRTSRKAARITVTGLRLPRDTTRANRDERGAGRRCQANVRPFTAGLRPVNSRSSLAKAVFSYPCGGEQTSEGGLAAAGRLPEDGGRGGGGRRSRWRWPGSFAGGRGRALPPVRARGPPPSEHATAGWTTTAFGNALIKCGRRAIRARGGAEETS